MSLAPPEVRLEWAARQQLGVAVDLSTAAATAWFYQTGGSGAYLSLRARCPTLRRADVDAAVADGTLEVTTGVRGCTFLAPAAEAPWAHAERRSHLPASLSDLEAQGLDRARFDALVEEVLAVCVAPVTPGEVRKRVTNIQAISAPKLGFSNTLPLALRVAEASGRLVRRPVSRLDDDRYVWSTRDAPPVVGDFVVPLVAQNLRTRSPVTTGEIARWMGVPVRSVSVPPGPPCAPAPDPDPSALHFLPFRDPFVEDRCPALVDPSVRDLLVDGWGKCRSPLGVQPTVHHHVVVCGAAIVGLWEWSDRLEVRFFGPPPEGAEAAIAGMDVWIREELGDVFIYAQDGAAQRARRLAVVWEG